MRIGSLFSGYGGLDMAVQSVLGGEVAWVSDIEPASCQVLAAHHPGANGRPRLSPAFVEWMMGLPAGHVTGHGLRPAQELKMLGNGVVPQQAALALRMVSAP